MFHPYSKAPTTKPTIVLVHGAWHGSWCWKYQIPPLETLGYAVETLDLPSSGNMGMTQFDDAAHVRAVVETLTSAGKRVIVLAHSYAGPIGSAAIKGLADEGVLGMIALVAYIYPGNMDVAAHIRKIGGLPFIVWDTPSPGLFLATDARTRFFAPDTPEDRIDWALANLRPQSMAANTGITPPEAWQDDSFDGRLGYIRCTADQVLSTADQVLSTAGQVLSLARQDEMITAAGGEGKWVVRTLEGSGHNPPLSRPDEVAAAVHEIVNEFEASSDRGK
ncbi:hypothetical protein N7512_001533 [Penicillium capsulatum]|nr:hypothetical protein N7512_001533 [Penicillium capsulatum]